MDLAQIALAAGATQLGEAGTLHFILTLEELERFVELCKARVLPPLPYKLKC
jgi:hypothetical protein